MLANEDLLRDEIAKEHFKRNKKIIVLDDDPTGVQTMHDIDILTQWDIDWLEKALQTESNVFYILTNTRSYQPDQVEKIISEIVKNIHTASKKLNVEVEFISRGDSTLRGHYPLEIDVLQRELERIKDKKFDGHLIIPAFFESGRYTVDNLHYIKENGNLIPIHETEFSKDQVFGFQNSHLGHWIEEKTNSRWKSGECVTLSLDDFKQGNIRIEEILMNVTNNTPIIVNALSYKELDILSKALNRVTKQGKSFLFRTAASFVKSYTGTKDIPYLEKGSMINGHSNGRGGLVVVGSHIKKTTEQLSCLLNEIPTIKSVELNVVKLLNSHERDKEIYRTSNLLNNYIESNVNVVLYSSRELMRDSDKLNNLNISQQVSSAIADIIQRLNRSPKFIIAKGGITSSDIATKGLHIKKARVIGQAAPGIPVWQTGEEAKFPNIPYIVFPGNVGNRETLKELILKIT